MTPEDLDRSLAIARFMGWTEAQTHEEQDDAGIHGQTCFATTGSGEIIVFPHAGLVPYMVCGGETAEDEDPVVSWCRAVSLGVLAAVEAAETYRVVAR